EVPDVDLHHARSSEMMFCKRPRRVTRNPTVKIVWQNNRFQNEVVRAPLNAFQDGQRAIDPPGRSARSTFLRFRGEIIPIRSLANLKEDTWRNSKHWSQRARRPDAG